ncbi:MAG: hypothetical protein AAFQ94_19175 [Bacteroidota bacterium]
MIKLNILVVFILMSQVSTCQHKNSDQKKNPVSGKWIVSAYRSNELKHEPSYKQRIQINFESDSTFSGTTEVNKFYGKFKVLDSVKLEFKITDRTEVYGRVWENVFLKIHSQPNSNVYNYNIEKDKLTLSIKKSNLEIHLKKL